MTPWLMAFICLATAGCTNVTDQQTSETQHDHQVAILKQIRKVNEDGSYTFGYEAGDGSFKEHVSVVQSIPRPNRTSTTRKPNVVYATEGSTRASVVQAIPRTRKTTTTPTTTTTTPSSTTEPQRPIFGNYVRAGQKGRPRFVINGQQRPVLIEEVVEDEDSQINRPNTEEKATSAFRKIVFTKRPVGHNLRPITEDFEEKDEDRITTGNTLRRQLQEETTKVNIPTEAAEDDRSDVYGGSLSTTRPLFTTGMPSRVLQRVIALRERPKTIYVNQENVGPAKFDSPRVYEPEDKTVQEERNANQFLIQGPTRAQSDMRDYVRQSSEPVYVRQQPDQYLRELPSGGILVQGSPVNPDEDPTYRAIPIGRILLRPLPGQQSLYSTTTDANVHYITENPASESMEPARVPVIPNFIRQRPFPRPYPEQELRHRPALRPMIQSLDESDYQRPIAPEYPYRSSALTLPPEPPNPIAPPLSRRDFQILLRRLLVSQYGPQALNYPKTYLEDALYDHQPYPQYQPAYQSPLPRRDLAYDQTTVPVQYGDRVPMRRPGLSRSLNPVYQPNQYDDYQDQGRYTKRVYRQKFYVPEDTDDGDEILPPPIREALLLRMLQLAINAERPPMNSMVTSTTTPSSRYRKAGPVRSVQIINEDSEEEKDMGKKM
ncbi:uncharacterized protein LOC105700181 [Orussus abietinus]|uniref:uncharacterized protein LOC105700181 n=1 Tax=Orussus abietinus TaxID=222816 RepID=UPI0006254D7F|nr:uncharacterized protein LOC105700181 [Orussus abietinus]